MIADGSRYEQAERQFTSTHMYSEWGFPLVEGEGTELRVRYVSRDTLYRMTTSMPPSYQPFDDSSDRFVIDTEGIQYLSYKFLGDARRWWEIADVNPKIWYPLDLEMGDYVRIPL